MFTQAKLIIYGVVAAILLSVITGCVWYYNWSQSEIQVLRANNTKLEFAVDTQKETIRVIKRDAKLAGEQVAAVSKEFEETRKYVDKLKTRMGRHNIAYLASVPRKTKKIAEVLNNATVNAERCFEILSGAELTESEIAATKKSQSNGECPELANPNYVPRVRK